MFKTSHKKATEAGYGNAPCDPSIQQSWSSRSTSAVRDPVLKQQKEIARELVKSSLFLLIKTTYK